MKIIAEGNDYRVLSNYDPFMTDYNYQLQCKAKFLWWTCWVNVPSGHGYGRSKLSDWCQHYDMREI